MYNHKDFFKFVIPSILAFALSGVYTIVDGFFVGQSLGDIGLASITLGYPVAAVIQAIGTGIGLSGAIRFTIFNAQKKTKEQKECFGGTTLLMLLCGALITALLIGLLYPLLRLLGAEGEILRLTAEYTRIIAIGTIFQILATGFIPFIRNMGGATFAMAAMIIGFVSNIIGDYLLVWVYGWGMAGAAWATIAGQALTMLSAVIYLAMKKIGFRLPAMSGLPGFFGSVLKVAAAPFGLAFTPTIIMILMNRFLLLYGSEQSIAIYSCIGYVTAVVYLLLQGIGDGSQPLISQYYGRKNVVVMKQIRSLAYKTGAVIIGICMVLLFLSRRHIGVLFGASFEASQGVAAYLPFFLATMLFLSFVRITTSYFYATEQTGFSYVLVYAEPLLLLVILLLAPPVIGLNGVWAAVPLAQFLNWCIAVFTKHMVDRGMAAAELKGEA